MRRIAIVDDDQMWIQMNRAAMESRGLIVESFFKPSQIIEAIDSNGIEFDVIVIDLMMPKDEKFDPGSKSFGFDTGLRLSKNLREKGCEQPIILISNVSIRRWIDDIKDELRATDKIVFMSKHLVDPFRLSNYIETIITEGIHKLDLERKLGFWGKLFGRIILQPNIYGIGFDLRKKISS